MDVRKVIREVMRHGADSGLDADVNAIVAVNVGGRSYYAQVPGEDGSEGEETQATTNEKGDDDGRV
jgi:hypothetical protein